MDALRHALVDGLPLLVSAWHAGYFNIPQSAIIDYLNAKVETLFSNSKER